MTDKKETINAEKFNDTIEKLMGDFPEFELKNPIPEVDALLKQKGDLAQAPTKECDLCARTLPVHPDFFHADHTKPDGHRSVCKDCRNMHLQASQVNQQAKQIDQFRERLAVQMTDHSDKVAPASGRRDNIGKMYESVLNAFGGIDMFGATVASVFTNATVSTQQKMLQNIIAMSKNVTEMGLADKNLEDMSIEELLAETERRARAGGFSAMAEDARKRLVEIRGKDILPTEEEKEEEPKMIEAKVIEPLVIPKSVVIGTSQTELTYAEQTEKRAGVEKE